MKLMPPGPIELKGVTPSPLQPDTAKALRLRAKEAAEQFEAVLVLQMVRSMQSSLEGGSIFGSGREGQVYGSLGEWELAKAVARSSDLGVEEQLLDYIKQSENGDDTVDP